MYVCTVTVATAFGEEVSRMWLIDRRHFDRQWTTPNQDFKITPISDAEYGVNGITQTRI